MDELKPCPFCGGKNIGIDGKNDGFALRGESGILNSFLFETKFSVYCKSCNARSGEYRSSGAAIRHWNTRYEPKTTEAKIIENKLFDHCEIYPNCTVEVLTNSVTGDVSYGWWRNDTEWQGA